MAESERWQGVDPDNPPYAAVRELLTAAFTADDLRRFLSDRPAFRPVLNSLPRYPSLNDIVDEVIEYCRINLLWDELLTEVRVENPRQFARFEPRLRGTGPALPPQEPDDGSTTRDPAVRDAERKRRQSPLPATPIRNRWALLVGINRYVDPAFPPLKFCVNDVLALAAALQAQGYAAVVMHDELARDDPRFPTRENVEAELTRLCQVAGADDLIWAHFACHGKLEKGKALLVTNEIRYPTLQKRALPLADVEGMMRSSQAQRVVLTLDACHTGVEMGREIADPEFIRNAYELAMGFALIAASTAQGVAQEWAEKQHGVFTYYLLQGLSGAADRANKGLVTVGDLATHVLDGLRRWNVEHGGLIQEPTARTEMMGDIILADHRGR